MVRKSRLRRRTKRKRCNNWTQDDSDKDFVIEEDDNADDSESAGISDGSLSSSEDEEYIHKGKKTLRMRSKKYKSGSRKPKKRKTRSCEEDGFDYNDDDDDDFTIDDMNVEEESSAISTRRGTHRKCNSIEKKKINISRRGRKVSMAVRGNLPQSQDRRFKNGYPVFRETRKQYLGQRDSVFDSDESSSVSSDYEFTISEEEREQVREAREFCQTSRTEGSQWFSKRNRDDPVVVPNQTDRRKGKEKVDENNTQIVNTCGICLTEEGNRTSRGALNCCRHYFCFSCILEWSKIESRCPLCKQRFKTIGRLSGSGIKVQNGTIHVPERNQVYQQAQDYVDPYEDTVCIECQQGEDENLMLLCDLCDSSAHTYCVGLGREVPDGNWYCEGCRPAVHGPSNPRSHSPGCEVITVDTPPPALVTVVNDSDDAHSPPPRRACSSSRSSVENVLSVSPLITLHGASTLGGRRWVERRVRSMISGTRTVDTFPRNDHFRTPVEVRGPSASRNSPQNSGLSSSMGGGPLVEDSNILVSGSGLSHKSDCVLLSNGKEGSFIREKELLQMMVKANLKELSSHERLGRESFKAITKRSTHAVMGSCGREERALDMYTVEPPEPCAHREVGSAGGGAALNLSSKCCSHCFLSFVRRVVQRTMDIVLMEMIV